ncbi:hypothetical protein E3N88_03956 [Mikania micrantha]|uniref:Retrotransposon gag domain-containing protein n=1 Tax=Mikania micrantha TaxID=192012 RepID=A0A5N6PV49_9ASTR|nr:hypothetical protein E3N88_03956 [Mikania micrantha]
MRQLPNYLLIPGINIKLGDGHVVLVQQQCVGMSVQIGPCSFLLNALVFDTGDLDLILGMEWLQSLGEVTHDWKHAWMKFMYCNQTVILQGKLLTQSHAAALQQWLPLDEDNHTLLELRMPQGVIILPEMMQDQLSPTQHKQLQSLLSSYAVLFQTPSGLAPIRAHDHHIPLTTDIPVAVRPYRYPHIQINEIE